MKKEDSGILIVDDHHIILDAVKSFFNQNGYVNIHTADDSRIALEILRTESYKIKLIITDINRQGMNGVEFVKEISRTHKYIVGIVFLTMMAKDMVFSAENKFDQFKQELNPHNIIGIDWIPKNNAANELLKPCEKIIKNVTEERVRQNRLNKNEQVALVLENGKFKLMGFAHDDSLNISDPLNNQHSLFYTYSFESIGLRVAIEELEFMINNAKIKESELQDFFTRYPDFLKMNEYKEIHPHLILENETNKKLIPDFVLEPINNQGLSDILDLKLPQQKVYVGNYRPRFSAEINKVCSQLREYSAFFESRQNRQKIKQKYGLELYSPKMITVIGRRQEIDPILIKRINQSLPNLSVKNYDDIIDEMKFRIK